MMSQTYPEQAVSDSTRVSYNSISTGGLMGWQSYSAVSEDCNGNKTSTDYDHKYQLMGLGFARTVQTGKAKSYTLGLSAYIGKHDEEITGSFSLDRPKLTTYGFNPFFQADFPKIAVGVGMHFGDMSFISVAPEASSVRRFSVYPQAYMRIGRLERFFFELSFARNFPSSFPGNVGQFNIGFPLKARTIQQRCISDRNVDRHRVIPLSKHTFRRTSCYGALCRLSWFAIYDSGGI